MKAALKPSSLIFQTLLLGVLTNFVVGETLSVNLQASKVLWWSKKVTAEHHGTVGMARGELLLNEGRITGGSFDVDMSSIVVLDVKEPGPNKKLLLHLKNDDFFSTQKHPVASYKITGIQKLNGDLHKISGDMTIKGKTNPVNFDGTLKQENQKWHLNGVLTLDRTLWDVKYRSGKFFENLGDTLIDDLFKVTVSLVTL